MGNIIPLKTSRTKGKYIFYFRINKQTKLLMFGHISGTKDRHMAFYAVLIKKKR